MVTVKHPLHSVLIAIGRDQTNLSRLLPIRREGNIFYLCCMIVSELRIYEFLTKELKIEETTAKRYVQDIVSAEEKLEQQVETKVDKQLGSAKDEIILRLEARIAESKADILKWMISFFIGLFVALLGSFAAILSLMK